MAFITFHPKDHFKTKTYSGNSGTQNITGIGFQPDMVWTKKRDGTDDHNIFDVVRGVTKEIRPNKSDYEDTASNGLTAFGTDGYTIGDWGLMNQGHTYVSWNWKAANSQGSSNTDGSINTTYTSANTTAGFSISKFTVTGSTATVGHGLGVAPKWILVKTLANAGAWQMYHASIGPTKYAEFHTNAFATSSGRWNDTAPTSSVFTISNEWSNGRVLIAYCFAEKTGFSKFGSYVGNGNADGAFVYTGFKPAWILWKATDGEGWYLYDTGRNRYNGLGNLLRPDVANADYNYAISEGVLPMSNGFKVLGSSGWHGTNAQEYIYMAFAEHPWIGDGSSPVPAK